MIKTVRKAVLSSIIVSMAIAATGCGMDRIGPGYVGIKVNMAGSDKGVSDLTAQTGWVFYNPISTSIFEYPTFVQNVVWTHKLDEGANANEEITFSNADQMQIAVDLNLSYQLNVQKIPSFYVKFRNDSLPTFSSGFLRSAVRDALNNVGGKYHIEQIMGDNAMFLMESRAVLQAELAPLGVEIVQFGLIGIPRPPPAVVEAINAKVHATQLSQQKENELMQVKADMAKEREKTDTYARNRTIAAEAEAEANRKIAASISPTLVDYMRANRWDGKLPQVTGSGGTLIDLTK